MQLHQVEQHLLETHDAASELRRVGCTTRIVREGSQCVLVAGDDDRVVFATSHGNEEQLAGVEAWNARELDLLCLREPFGDLRDARDERRQPGGECRAVSFGRRRGISQAQFEPGGSWNANIRRPHLQQHQKSIQRVIRSQLVERVDVEEDLHATDAATSVSPAAPLMRAVNSAASSPRRDQSSFSRASRRITASPSAV